MPLLLRRAVVVGLLGLVLGVGFHRLLTHPDWLIADGERSQVDYARRQPLRPPGNDVTLFVLPRFEASRDQLIRDGSLPLWDPSGFGGRPLVGNPQAGVFYPPLWLALAWGQPAAPGWLTVAHLLGAGVGVYALARTLGLGRWGAIVAGGCFEASPYLMAQTFEGHYAHVWSACWYPWAFWAAIRARRGDRVGFWLLPPILALCFLAGHPQEWYYLMVALGVWFAWDVAAVFRADGPAKGIRQGLAWSVVLAAALAFCAVELLPERAMGPWLLKATNISLRSMTRYYVHSINLVQLLDPFALGKPDGFFGHDNYWETVFSVGLAPLILMLVAVGGSRRRELVRAWGALVVVAALLAAGKKMGVYALAYALLPGMNRFRVPARTLFLATLGAAVLAGAGVDALGGEPVDAAAWDRWRKRLLGLLAGIAATVGLVALAPAVRPGLDQVVEIGSRETGDDADIRLGYRGVRAAVEVAGSPLFWTTLAGMAATLALAGTDAFPRRRAALALGVLALTETAWLAQSLLVCAPAESFVDSGRRREGPERVAAMPLVYSDWQAARDGAEKTNVNDWFQIDHAARLYEQLYPFLDPLPWDTDTDRPMDLAVREHRGAIAQRVFDLFSVGEVRADRPLDMPGLDFVRKGPGDRPDEIRAVNRDALPRAYVVPRAREFRGLDRDVIVQLLGVDPHEHVLMDHDPLPEGARQAFKAADWSRLDAQTVAVAVETAAPGLLVVGETWMPGWTAEVDGKAVPVLRGNHWQQVVPLATAGTNRVVLRYRTPGLFAGALTTAAACVAWLGVGALLATRERRIKRSNHHANVFKPNRAASGSTIRA